MSTLRPSRIAPLTITLVLALSACAGGDARSGETAADSAAAPADIVVADAGLSTPESVLHDPASDLYLVSNINGSPLDADDNGFISRVSPDGALLELKWIDGASPAVELNAPKGMAVEGGTLFVADITCIRRFDAATAAPAGEICPPGATFLNDVAGGGDGTVWFTDSGYRMGAGGLEPSGTDAVYRYFPECDSLVVVAKDPALGGPNGVAVGGQGALVVTFGTGEAYRIGADGQRTPVLPASQRQLDGVELLPDGGFLATSWGDQCVYRVGADGMLTKALEGVEAPADLGWDAGRRRLLVPLFNANRVVIHPLH